MLELLDHHRHRVQVIDRDVEEALDLAGVEIDREHAVGARRGDEVGDELGA